MTVRHWAVVPAAGVGQRMGAELPKQYLQLAGRTIMEHTLERLLQHPSIHGTVVALGKADQWWADTEFADHPDVLRAEGGVERSHSVLNALDVLSATADDADWVLVHDAARPCVRQQDISLLIEQLSRHPVGGLLGVPVRDTMKRTDGRSVILETVERSNLWHAFTPQMFRLGQLRKALLEALAAGVQVTDEASAMEWAGHAPLMIEGHRDNIKITRPEDLSLAGYLLQQQA